MILHRNRSTSNGHDGLGRTYGPNRVGRLDTYDPRPRRRFTSYDPSDLAVECWCRAEVVSVPQKAVMACLTDSCGRPGCQPPEVEACASSAN